MQGKSSLYQRGRRESGRREESETEMETQTLHGETRHCNQLLHSSFLGIETSILEGGEKFMQLIRCRERRMLQDLPGLLKQHQLWQKGATPITRIASYAGWELQGRGSVSCHLCWGDFSVMQPSPSHLCNSPSMLL